MDEIISEHFFESAERSLGSPPDPKNDLRDNFVLNRETIIQFPALNFSKEGLILLRLGSKVESKSLII